MNDFEDLMNSWDKGKSNLPQSEVNSQALMKMASESKNKSIQAQYITIIVLSITLGVLVWFFINVAPFQELLSRIGVAFMCGGLLVRIVIEIVSLIKSKMLNINQTTDELTESIIAYYHYRSKIHGTLTYVIIALYIIGFYMLTPEFMQYLDMKWIWLMDLGFIVIAVVLFFSIRIGVLRELAVLKGFKEAQTDLYEDNL